MILKKYPQASSQDRGVDGYTFPTHTTKTRTTTNLKTKNNQNCQKIDLHGSLTTRELKKKHSSRLVGGKERGNQSRRGGAAKQQLEDWPGEVAAGSPTFACR